MADVDLYTLTKSSDANTYHFRDDRVEDLAEVDVDEEEHALEIEGHDIATITTLAQKMSTNLAPIETSTASTNYTQGQFMTIGNVLVQAMENIATGETIIIGENVEQVDVADFLEDLISKYNAMSIMLPTVPAAVGKYILTADRRVGGTLIYAWEKNASGDYDYSHLTYWHNNGLYVFNKDDSGTSIPVLATSNVSRFIVGWDESYNSSPKLNSKNIWGAYIPADVATINITLATGSMIYPMVVKQHHFPDNSTYYERLYCPGWVSPAIYQLDIDQIREDAGSYAGDLYYFIEVCKTNYGAISADEVAQYYPGIEYVKGGA